MYPHERSLVKRLEQKPFVLLGVNSDHDRDALKQVIVKEQIAWRSWWDGGGTGGPIARQWNVRFWPTIFVLDSRGMIRYKNPQGRDLEEAVQALLAEMEAEKTR